MRSRGPTSKACGFRDRWRRTAHAASGDDGQITLLAIAFTMLALLLITAVVSATGIHLERKRLVALADALSLEAADAMDTSVVYRSGARAPEPGAGLVLTDHDVSGAVDTYLRDNPEAAAGFTGLVVRSEVEPDGRTARVELVAVAHPTLISWVTAPWSDGVTMHAESSARAW